ncbi:hypothetical protein C8J43_102747 [Sphingomonas sp. PP-CE-1G-424]|nr:hypothetical protein C8J43_102747 [Sphingomonas sp. PP-CE-1G-424]
MGRIADITTFGHNAPLVWGADKPWKRRINAFARDGTRAIAIEDQPCICYS